MPTDPQAPKPDTRRSYDRVAWQYDATRGWPEDVGAEIGRGLYTMLEAAAGHVPRVLEVGAGTGRVLLPLAEAGAWAVGMDVSTEMLERLDEKRAGRDACTLYRVLGEAQRLPFGDGGFDAALLVHVLHLVDDWQGVLVEVRRVVRPGGVIVLGMDEQQAGEDAWIEARWLAHVIEAGYKHLRLGARQAITRQAVGYLEALGYSSHEAVLARWTVFDTPAARLSQLRDRCFSSSWDLPDDVLIAALARLTAEMEARYGSLLAQITKEHWFRVVVCR